MPTAKHTQTVKNDLFSGAPIIDVTLGTDIDGREVYTDDIKLQIYDSNLFRVIENKDFLLRKHLIIFSRLLLPSFFFMKFPFTVKNLLNFIKNNSNDKQCFRL